MAENLGQAVLELTANTQPIEEALKKLRSDLNRFKAGKIRLDIDKLGGEAEAGLKNLSNQAERTKAKVQTLNQVLNSFVPGTYNKLSATLERLAKESRELQISSQDYLKVLQRITELEFVRSSRVGRQRVNAQFEAFKGPLLKEGYGSEQYLPELPKTVAADIQRISELTLRLQNVEKGTNAYKLALRQLAQAQRGVIENNRQLSNSLTQNLTGFGRASRDNFATSAGDQAAIDKSIRRNRAKAAKQELQEGRQRAALEEALAQQVSKREQAEERINQAAKERIAEVGRELTALVKTRQEREKQARLDEKAQNKRRSERNKRFKDAIGNAIVGGAFPALFGQGIGASIGGGVGGLAGGFIGGNFGFGLSLVGTAIGQSVDNLAQALENPIENFDLLRQSAILSSKSLEKFVEGLIATGRESEAAALIDRDLQQNFGAENLRAIEELKKKNDELGRSWARLTTAIGALAAGPVTRLAELLNSITGGGTGSASRVSDSQFTEALKNIERDFGRGAASDVARFKFFNNQVAPKPGEPVGQTVERQNRAALDYAQKQGYITKEVAKAKADELDLEEKIAKARQRSNQEYQNSFRLISAQVQGNRTAQLDERAVAVEDDRNRTLRQLDARKVGPNDARRTEANQKAALELYRIEEERLQLQKELAQTIDQEVIKRQSIARQIAATTARRDASLAAGDAAASPGNSFLAARAGQLEGASFLAENRLKVEQAITRQLELQAQLANESDPTKQAQINEQILTASQEIRAAGVEAGAALAEKAATAAKSLQGARDSLRSSLESGYKFLSRDAQRGLRQQAIDDVRRGKQTGVIRDTIGTGSRRRLFEVAGFVRNVEQQQAQIAQQQALVDALRENTTAERRIQINVTTSANGSAVIEQSSALY